MDTATSSHSSGRLPVALAVSLLFHGLLMAGGVAQAARQPVPPLREPDVSPQQTQFVYLEMTGPSLQISKRAVTSPAQRSAAVSPLTSLWDGSSEKSMQPYLEQLRSKLGRQIQYASGQPGGEVSLYFVLDQRGNLKGVQLILEKTRAASLLQQQALKGLQSASPFPPLPASWAHPTAAFTIRILFRSDE